MRKWTKVDVKTHNRNGYANGCRCETCHEDRMKYQREYRLRKRMGKTSKV